MKLYVCVLAMLLMFGLASATATAVESDLEVDAHFGVHDYVGRQ